MIFSHAKGIISIPLNFRPKDSMIITNNENADANKLHSVITLILDRRKKRLVTFDITQFWAFERIDRQFRNHTCMNHAISIYWKFSNWINFINSKYFFSIPNSIFFLWRHKVVKLLQNTVMQSKSCWQSKNSHVNFSRLENQNNLMNCQRYLSLCINIRWAYC